ncbi:MAG: MmgE/PrpD family protein [Pseudomonadota bacterium]
MSVAAELAAFAVTAEPDPALHATIRPAVADCFGCILGGAESDVARRIGGGLAQGAEGRAPLYGTGRTAAPGHAALLNAAAGHAYDLDDWEEPGNTHPTVVILPACLAAVHLRPIDGGALLAAYAVGFEVVARLGEAVSLDHYARGFHSTATLGAIAAAAAVSRLLGLTEAQATHALSLAASQAVGYTVQFGSNAKPLQAGLAARAGLESALMARAGATGQERVIEDPRGFAGLMGQAGRPLKPLGDPWALREHGLILKPWPSCGYTHRLMTAALELRPQLEERLSEITAIHGTQPDFHNAILPFERPTTRNEALFSAPACIAQALVTGRLTLDDSEARFWEDSAVARLITVTNVAAEPARNPHLNYDPAQPDRLTVVLGEEVLSQDCAYPLGAPQNPMSEAQLAEKFASVTGRDAGCFAHLQGWPEASDIAVFFQEYET